MTDWTPPTHVAPGASIESAKHNVEVVDNLKHLREAKVALLARFAETTLQSGASFGISWDYEAFDTMGAWSPVPNPERIYPRPAGFYRVSTQFQFPGNGTGIRQVIVNKIGTGESVVVARATSAPSPTHSITVSASCIVEMNGTTDYLYIEAYQNSGGPLTTPPLAQNIIDLEWIGA